MQLIPAIDIQHGACVRLLRGDFSSTTVYDSDPLIPARHYGELGAPLLHIVDLDGAASGSPVNTELIRRMGEVSGCFIQTGGGLRDEASVSAALVMSRRVVLGSLIISNKELTLRLLDRIGTERIVLALDVRPRDGSYFVCTEGWAVETRIELHELLNDYALAGLRHVLVTDIDRDGALGGPNLALYRDLVRRHPELAVQASGGIRDARDLHALRDSGVAAAISGKALLERRISNEEMKPYLQNA